MPETSRLKKSGFSIAASRRDESLVISVKANQGAEFRPAEIVEFIFAGAPDKISAKAGNSKITFDGREIAADTAVESGGEFELSGFFTPAGIVSGPAAGGQHKRKEIRLSVPYEDDFIAVVEKPAGMMIHSDGTGGAETLCSALDDHFARRGERTAKAYPIHRLDIGTSGLIIFAKDNMTCALLDRALVENAVSRRYTAIVEGVLKSRAGVIDLAIGRDRHVSNKFRVSKTGKQAVTRYKLISASKSENISVVEAELETGRTHQIRVHFSHIGHPLAGDGLYGAKSKGFRGREFALHSSFVRFIHPYSKKVIELESKPDFIR
jgi:23S rRNA pseudouridine1911/1915/1917 synthase